MQLVIKTKCISLINVGRETEEEACINRVTKYILQNIIFFNFIAYKIISVIIIFSNISSHPYRRIALKDTRQF